MRNAAREIVSALLDRIDKIVDDESELFPPELFKHRHKIFAAFPTLRTPDLNRGYYVYGILDCTAQIATLVDPGKLPRRLTKILKHLITTLDAPECRWKAVCLSIPYSCSRSSSAASAHASSTNWHLLQIEILLSCRQTREEQCQTLKELVNNGHHAEEIAAEIKTIAGFLQRDEEKRLRPEIKRCLTCKEQHIPSCSECRAQWLTRFGKRRFCAAIYCCNITKPRIWLTPQFAARGCV